ncbi:MAG TPA: putative quinol monooxygenase [Sporichthyaceae bacterium]|nr:putative quinol monooxygenase [Sporichthyaceae bacterium]
MFVVIARYVVAPENQERVRQLLVPLALLSREEPGNLGYLVVNDLEDPAEFRIIESYVDRAAFDAHLNSEHYHEFGVHQIRPLLADRQFSTYEAVPGT